MFFSERVCVCARLSSQSEPGVYTNNKPVDLRNVSPLGVQTILWLSSSLGGLHPLLLGYFLENNIPRQWRHGLFHHAVPL